MMKKKLHGIVYKYKVAKKAWLRLVNLRVHYLFKYRKVSNRVYFAYLTKIKKYKEVTFEKKITNGIFKVFLREDRNTVIKVTRRDNINSYSFHRKIKSKADRREYADTLITVCSTKLLDEHITKVNRIFADGGYESPYINGINLQIMKLELLAKENSLDETEKDSVLKAAEELAANLENYYHERNELSGDWMLYNLIYDTASKKIVNIDLEGFYTFPGNQEENDVERIKNELEELSGLLKQSQPLSDRAVTV